MRVEIKYYSWSWDLLPDEGGAAFAEQWTYDGSSLVERKRIPMENTARTISTDPRAAAIMREELGQQDRLGTMGAPSWARD